ncbi:MAG: hypothetical protein CL844_03910, partial [Crocinitomicaceae bacterium]|nr:hypothetical protein [Crocinitomicaceae bacterium]
MPQGTPIRKERVHYGLCVLNATPRYSPARCARLSAALLGGGRVGEQRELAAARGDDLHDGLGVVLVERLLARVGVAAQQLHLEGLAHRRERADVLVALHARVDRVQLEVRADLLPVPLGHVDALLLGGLGHLGLVHERGHLVQRELAHRAHVLGDEVGDGRDLGGQRAADARDASDGEGALVARAHDARRDRGAVVALGRRAARRAGL